MKKIIFISIFIVVAGFLFAKTDFSGTAAVTINANITDSGGYSSLLNPGNILEISDIAISSSFIVKLDAGDDKTTFSAWVSLKDYPLGQGLLAAAYSDSEQSGVVNDFLYASGSSIYTPDLMRLRANVYLTDNISLEVGRQSMLTGYGYGWNPIDFADPLKNPRDPNAELKGVDACVLNTYLGNTVSLKLYALVPPAFLNPGFSYREIKPGGELTVSLPGIELKAAGIWDYDTTEGNDAYTSAAGLAFNFDFFGIGVYGETSMRKGSRNYFTNGAAATYRKTDWLFSGLAGLQYTFSSEGNVVFEYFYNGEGYNKAERTDFMNTLKILPGPTTEIFKMYTPGYFARQYLLVNLMQPFYALNTDVGLSVLYSPDSEALMVMPSLHYTFSGSFEGTVGYTGMFDVSNGDFNEVTALPFHHSVQAVFKYSF